VPRRKSSCELSGDHIGPKEKVPASDEVTCTPFGAVGMHGEDVANHTEGWVDRSGQPLRDLEAIDVGQLDEASVVVDDQHRGRPPLDRRIRREPRRWGYPSASPFCGRVGSRRAHRARTSRH
jgi:hypothetical protein